MKGKYFRIDVTHRDKSKELIYTSKLEFNEAESQYLLGKTLVINTCSEKEYFDFHAKQALADMVWKPVKMKTLNGLDVTHIKFTSDKDDQSDVWYIVKDEEGYLTRKRTERKKLLSGEVY
jgi:hypothetical protein